MPKKKREEWERDTQKISILSKRKKKKESKKKKEKKKGLRALKIKKDTQNAHKLRAQRKRSFGRRRKDDDEDEEKEGVFARVPRLFFCVYIQTRSLSFKKKGGFILREREKNAPEKKDEEHEHY